MSARRVLRVAAARASTLAPSLARFPAGLYSMRPDSFGQPAEDMCSAALARARLVVVGELHAMPPVVEFEKRAAEAMLESTDEGGTLHIVLEHFSFEMQHLLDDYAAERIGFEELLAGYDAIGTEGHDVPAYEPLLRLAHGGRVALHGGFIPRTYARTIMRESLDAALEAAKAKGYVHGDEQCAATEAHYSFFESLLSGRDPHGASPPTDQYRRMFPAQVIKDAAMAHYVNSLVARLPAADRVLVLCGIGHSGYSHGVPERVFAAHPHLEPTSLRVWCAMARDAAHLAPHPDAFGMRHGTDPADVCFAFAEAEVVEAVDEGLPAEAGAGSAAPGAAAAVKAETADAYNRVGQTAHLEGDATLARALMRRLGYTAEDVALAAEDVHNFQGVASPHGHAALRAGETVVDLGSGLGIDSFIAAARVGPSGAVLGVDLSREEVRHASARAEGRRLKQVRFVQADLEQTGVAAASVDAVISNGAFCLAPDKRAAFAEVCRVLKPGGRFAIATSTVKMSLDAGVNWPTCMRMFAHVDELGPLCEAVGLIDVLIDRSDPAMQFELAELEGAPEAESGAEGRSEESDEGAGGRNRVHVGSPEFGHLKGYDMNALCERVVVTGRKPSS